MAARTSAETIPFGVAFLAGLFERVDLRAIVGVGVVVVLSARAVGEMDASREVLSQSTGVHVWQRCGSDWRLVLVCARQGGGAARARVAAGGGVGGNVLQHMRTHGEGRRGSGRRTGMPAIVLEQILLQILLQISKFPFSHAGPVAAHRHTASSGLRFPLAQGFVGLSYPSAPRSAVDLRAEASSEVPAARRGGGCARQRGQRRSGADSISDRR